MGVTLENTRALVEDVGVLNGQEVKDYLSMAVCELYLKCSLQLEKWTRLSNIFACW